MVEVLKGFLDCSAAEYKQNGELDRLLAKDVNPYEPKTHDEAWRLAQIVADSGMYGLAGAPEQAYVILMCGRDLGLSQSQALRGIQNIKGKPAPSADTLVAVCLASPMCEYFERDNDKSNETTEVWRTKRRGRVEQTVSFGLDDAQRAGLLPAKKESAWDLWPRRMMSSRAKAFLARDVYPDVTLGLFTAEELQSIPSSSQPERRLAPVTKSSISSAQVDDPTLLDPPQAPWHERMAAAKDKAEATRIGKEAIAEDPSRRMQALSILKGFAK